MFRNNPLSIKGEHIHKVSVSIILYTDRKDRYSVPRGGALKKRSLRTTIYAIPILKLCPMWDLNLGSKGRFSLLEFEISVS